MCYSLVRTHQCQILAAGTELEVGVQRSARVAVVVVRGEDEEVLAGVEIHCREFPFAQVAVVVGQVPVFEIDLQRADIINLNPVWEIAARVSWRTGVGRHKLIDYEGVALLKPVRSQQSKINRIDIVVSIQVRTTEA